ncbi:MAG: FAD-binding oxidoreductase [Chloroflexi bacterium]|nr:FAD-binding oxidoreductase [Chloroflexota bacterium]MCL5274428.1 FAD-binding oxidoreductase [Chloroflexota bacterium]
MTDRSAVARASNTAMDARTKGKDVLVIGAGLVGAFIANLLANNGLRVAVVDAQYTAQAATRRAVGLATPMLVREQMADTLRGVEIITSTAQRLGVPPRACRVLHLSSSAAGTDALRALYDDLKGGKPKLTWELEPGTISIGFGGGLVAHNSALIDLETLAARLLRHSRISVYEHVEIQSLEWHNEQLSALSAGNTVYTDAIILATNAYAGILSPYLADAAGMVRGVTWSSRPLNDAPALLQRVLQTTPMPLIIDQAQLTVAQTLDGRLRIAAWRKGNQGDPAGDIAQFLHTYLRALARHTDEWRTGVTSLTPDGIPLVGKLAGDGTVLYALGAGIYGPAWAPLMAERIAQLLEG